MQRQILSLRSLLSHRQQFEENETSRKISVTRCFTLYIHTHISTLCAPSFAHVRRVEFVYMYMFINDRARSRVCDWCVVCVFACVLMAAVHYTPSSSLRAPSHRHTAYEKTTPCYILLYIYIHKRPPLADAINFARRSNTARIYVYIWRHHYTKSSHDWAGAIKTHRRAQCGEVILLRRVLAIARLITSNSIQLSGGTQPKNSPFLRSRTQRNHNTVHAFISHRKYRVRRLHDRDRPSIELNCVYEVHFGWLFS